MKGRPLFHEERPPIRQALQQSQIADDQTIDHALDHCRLIPFDRSWPPLLVGLRPTIAYLALHRRARAIALGTNIYLRHTLFDQQARLPLSLITHEVAHVVQFHRDGTFPFLARYLGEYLAARLRGRPDRDAYLAISYEAEARRVERFLSH